MFYPSLVLYSSLSLRDPLVLFLMIVGTIYLVDQKYLNFFLVILPLYLIKFQNFFFMLVIFGIFVIFKKSLLRYNIRYILLGLIILSFYFYIDKIIYVLELSRGAFFRENGGDMQFYKPLDGLYSLLIYGASGLPHFLMKPLPWEVDNFFQLIQSIENIFVLFFLIIFTTKAYKQSKFPTIKWFLFLVIVMSIHGVVVFNYGSAVRYKYTFIVMYVVGLAYELYKINGYLFTLDFIKNITKKN